MDRGAWRATVHRVTRVGHELVTKSPLSKVGFPGGSDCKESSCWCRRPSFNPWVRKAPWKREEQPTFSWSLNITFSLEFWTLKINRMNRQSFQDSKRSQVLGGRGILNSTKTEAPLLRTLPDLAPKTSSFSCSFISFIISFIINQ